MNTRPAPVPTHAGFECPFCAHWTKTEVGGKRHIAACKVAKLEGNINGHAARIRVSRGHFGQFTTISCSCTEHAAGTGVNMGRVVTDLDYLLAVYSLHRSTGAALIDVVNGDA